MANIGKIELGSNTTHLEDNRRSAWPFCGGEAFIRTLSDTSFRIRCEGCSAETGMLPTAEEAVDGWNERK